MMAACCGAYVASWHIAAQSQCGGMSAAGESRLCIIATSAAGSALRHAILRFLSGAAGEHGDVCILAEGDMRALNYGAGFDPGCVETHTAVKCEK
jgi:hypothetical protein